MKKNRTMRVAVLMLALTLLTCCFVGSTFAKYISEADGSSSVTVAKWKINVGPDGNEVDITGTNAITFNLFDTAAASLDDNGTDVAQGKVAPGTAGSFSFDIENASEVTAKYTVTLTETNAGNVYIQYSLDGSTWKDSIDELDATADDDKAVITANLAYTGAADDKADTITVYWRWVFDGTTEGAHAGQTDTTDTTLGVNAQTNPAEVIVAANIVVEQVD